MSQRRRAKRHERLDPPPAMRMTPRDLAVIEAVYQYRVLTQSQIERLLFTGLNREVARRRLFLLYHNGYLERQFLPTTGGLVTSPVLYLLDKRGGEYLLQRSGHTEIRWKARDNRVGNLYLEHLLNINTFRIEITLATAHYQCPLEGWIDDAMLHQDYDKVRVPGVGRPVAVIPDGYFRIPMPDSKPMHFFLELDRGTMDLGRFKQKMQAYQVYAQTGLALARFNTKGFRVLTVTLDEARLHNLRAATADAGGANRFWFGVLQDLTADKVLSEPVWGIAGRARPARLLNPVQLARPDENP